VLTKPEQFGIVQILPFFLVGALEEELVLNEDYEDQVMRHLFQTHICILYMYIQGILKGEVSLYRWPPV
jgi:hypothetical protein